MPISEYQEQEVEVELDGGEGAGRGRGITASNRKRGEGGRGGERRDLFRRDTKRHFMKQVLNT